MDQPTKRLLGGLMNCSYLLIFQIADETNRSKLAALCEGPWQGETLVAARGHTPWR